MKHIVWSLALVAGLAGLSGGAAFAQQAPASPAAAPAAAPAPGGIQSQNIFEVKPDASADANA